MTRETGAWSEHDYYRQQAEVARKRGQHNTARYYEYLAKDALRQLERERRDG